MTFANVSVNQEQLTLLSQLLLAAFPGCIIHQSRDPMQAAQRLSNHKVDAIFADAAPCFDWLHLLRRHKSNPPVYLLCGKDLQPPEGTEDIQGIVTYPITSQKIQVALQPNSGESREDI